MVTVKRKRIDVEHSEILYDREFTEQSLAEDWEAAALGKWWVEDGVLNGRYPGNGGGILYSKKSYQGDILLDFYGRTVAPCNNDLNFVWRAEGWDYRTNDAGVGYIAGLQGWWEGKAGIEKYPECSLFASTAIFDYTPGKFYHIQAGIVEDSCFIYVDEKLVLELSDPDPIDSSKYGRVGLGTYCSFNQYRDFKILRPVWEKENFSYTPLE